MTTKGTDNRFRSLTVVGEPGTPSTPASGDFKLYVADDGTFFLMDDTGATVDLTAAGFSDPMTTRGDIIIRNASNVTTRLGRGSAGQVLTSDGTDVAWATPAASGDQLLAYHKDTSGDHTTSSATIGDVDATNASVTFTAPVSTNVLVRLSASVSPGTTASAYCSWGLRESTSNIAGAAGDSIVCRAHSTPSSNDPFVAASLAFVLTGISAGSHTYKWSHAVSAGTATLIARANCGAIMEVWRLP